LESPPEVEVSKVGWISLLVLFTLPVWGFTLEIPSDAETMKLLTPHVKGREETLDREVRRLGNKTIEMEAFLSTDGDLDRAAAILSDFAHYRDWALENINHRPAGGEYYLKLKNLNPEKTDPSKLVADLVFDLPIFKKEMSYTLKFDFKKTGKSLLITMETMPKEDSPIKTVEAFIKILPDPKRPDWAWLYLKGRAVLTNWLLYEALPDRVLTKETGMRFQIVVDNYHKAETKMTTVKTATTPARSQSSEK
jgi:hypothetical protein